MRHEKRFSFGIDALIAGRQCSSDAGNQSSVAFEVRAESATTFSASAKGRGNSFPRFAARRRIPEQAFALKKYRGCTSPVSKVSDNEHTAASLGHSEILSVKNAVGEPIPEFCQPPEQGSKCPTSVCRQDAGDVFPYQPAGPISCSNGKIGKHEVATRVCQSFSESGDAEALAGSSADEKIDSCIGPYLEVRHVAEIRHGRIVMREQSARKRLDLAEPCRAPAQWMPRDTRGLDPRANGTVDHTASHKSFCPRSSWSVSTRGLAGVFQLPPPRAPTSRHPAPRRLEPPSAGNV